MFDISMQVKLLSWNVRELNRISKRNIVKSLMQNRKANIYCSGNLDRKRDGTYCLTVVTGMQMDEMWILKRPEVAVEA